MFCNAWFFPFNKKNNVFTKKTRKDLQMLFILCKYCSFIVRIGQNIRRKLSNWFSTFFTCNIFYISYDEKILIGNLFT